MKITCPHCNQEIIVELELVARKGRTEKQKQDEAYIFKLPYDGMTLVTREDGLYWEDPKGKRDPIKYGEWREVTFRSDGAKELDIYREPDGTITAEPRS